MGTLVLPAIASCFAVPLLLPPGAGAVSGPGLDWAREPRWLGPGGTNFTRDNVTSFTANNFSLLY